MRTLALLIAALCCASGVSAGGPPKTLPRLSDIPFIRCQVCRVMVENAYGQAKELRAKATPEFPVQELSMIEMLEKMTTAWRPEGEWITHFDIAQEGDELRLRDMGESGQCNQKCKTIEKAAFECMGDSDTELASALLLQRLDLPDMTDWFCSEETWACRPPLPKVPDSRKPGEDWEKKKDADEDFEAIMGSMGDAGLKGSLFSREELERHMAEIDESVGDVEGMEGGVEEEDPSDRGSYDPVEMAQEQSMSVADEALRQIDLAERRHKGDYPLYEGDPEDDDSDDELDGSKAAGVPLAEGESVAVEGFVEEGETEKEGDEDHADSEDEDEEEEAESGDESDEDDEDDGQHPVGMTKEEEAMAEALAKKPLSEEEVEFFDKLDEENDVLVVEDVDVRGDVDDEDGLTKEELDALQTEPYDQDADEEHEEL